jgi:multidrug efflux pump subunit AcrB
MSLGTATEKVADVVREVMRDVVREIERESLDASGEAEHYTVGFGGQKEEMDRAMASLRRALLLAVFLVFVVMAMQFESLVQPLVIIVAIPLAMVGVIPVLSLFDIPLSIVVFIGMIVLAGIVVNNAIVLVDTANQLRRGGATVREALLRAGELRLRPILMTTTTTVLGLLPLTGILGGLSFLEELLGTGEGAEIRAPLAVTVIAGLIASTVLTLLVVPVMYSTVLSALAAAGRRGDG